MKSSPKKGLFLAFKTPLSKRYNHKIPQTSHFSMSMLLDDANNKNRKIGLIINLTDTNRYYDPISELREKNIEYKKINCAGQQAPSVQQTKLFIDTCYDFNKRNPSHVIGVHCTHGFNRTGFLICSYLIEKLDYSAADALQLFNENRPPGIYRQNIVNDLFYRYGSSKDVRPTVGKKPDWHNDGERSHHGNKNDNRYQTK